MLKTSLELPGRERLDTGARRASQQVSITKNRAKALLVCLNH